MDAIERFGNLKQRKEALVMQSDLNRLMLRLEVENLRSAATRFDESISKARRLAAWLLPAISVLGVITGRRSHKTGSSPTTWIKRIVQYLPALMELWRRKQS